jgi:hypothetical protein
MRTTDDLLAAWTTAERDADVEMLTTLLTDDVLGVGPLASPFRNPLLRHPSSGRSSTNRVKRFRRRPEQRPRNCRDAVPSQVAAESAESGVPSDDPSDSPGEGFAVARSPADPSLWCSRRQGASKVAARHCPPAFWCE